MGEVDYTREIETIVLQRMSAVNRRQVKELWTKSVPETKYLKGFSGTYSASVDWRPREH
jgi:hypothetical protein